VIIDVHNHAVPRSVVELVAANPVYGMSASEKPAGPLRLANGQRMFSPGALRSDPATKVAQLDQVGIDAAVVSLLPTLYAYEVEADAAVQLCETANSGLCEYAAHDPSRLRWMAHVPLGVPDQIPSTLSDAMALGAAGVAVGTAIGQHRLDDAQFEPFWASAEELGLPVFIHPNYPEEITYPGLRDFHLANCIGHPMETTITIERLICAGTLDRHPGVRVVLSHAGGMFALQAGRLKHARTVRPELASAPIDPWAYRGQISVDTIAHDEQALRFVVERMGVENVLLGTDLPADMAPVDPVGEILKAVGDTAADTIMRENPARLYAFAK
jgi:aminocarboxymuconate-semialdehyde decarboxylase